MKKTTLTLILFSLSTATATASASVTSSDEGNNVLYLSLQTGPGHAEFSNSSEGQFANKMPYSLAKYGYDNKLSNSIGHVNFIVGFAGKNKFPIRIEFMAHINGNEVYPHDKDISETAKRKLSLDLSIYSTNVFYDFVNQSFLTPYIFVTSGVAATSLKVVDTNNTSGKETTQANEESTQGIFGGGVGFAIDLSENFKIDTTLSYSQNITPYLDNKKNENKDNYYWKGFRIIDLSVGLRYHFNWF